MANSATRSRSMKSTGYSPETLLAQDRHANDNRLKTRFETIFEKYEKDFTNVGDEIDLQMGKVVVNNGHLARMKHEVDCGRGASYQFVKAFEHNLEREEDGDETEGDKHEDCEDSEGSFDGEEDHGGASDDSGGEDQDGTIVHYSDEEDELLSSPCKLAASEERRRRRDPVTPRSSTLRRTIAELADKYVQDLASSLSTGVSTTGLIDAVPALKDSMAALRSRSQKSTQVDPNAITALGQSIANQIAQFMSTASSRKSIINDKARSTAWDVPQIPSRKRKRSASPLTRQSRKSSRNSKGSPPGQESLWAPAQDRRLTGSRKKQRLLAEKLDDLSSPITGGVQAYGTSRGYNCENCGTNQSSTWRTDPRRVGLQCTSCAQYFHEFQKRKVVITPLVPTANGLILKSNLEASTNLPKDGANSTGCAANTARRRHSETPGQVDETFFQSKNPRFTHADDELMAKLRTEDDLTWSEMAVYFPGRSVKALKQRCYYKKLADSAADDNSPAAANITETVVKGVARQSRHEDALLLKLRDEGKLDWPDIADLMPDWSIESLVARYHGMRARLGRRSLGDSDSGDAVGVDQVSEGYGHEEGANRKARDTAEEDEPTVKLRNDGCVFKDTVERLSRRRISSPDSGYVQHIEPRLCRQAPASGSKADANAELQDPPGIDQPSVRGVRYTEEEDHIIFKSRQMEGLGWPEIAARLPDRPVSSISRRYYQHILPRQHPGATGDNAHREDKAINVSLRRPSPLRGALPGDDSATDDTKGSKNRSRYTKEDNKLILRLKVNGYKWPQIVEHLPGRTIVGLKTHYSLNWGPNKRRSSLPELASSPWPLASSQRNETRLLRQALENHLRSRSSALAPTATDQLLSLAEGELPSTEGYDPWETTQSGSYTAPSQVKRRATLSPKGSQWPTSGHDDASLTDITSNADAVLIRRRSGYSSVLPRRFDYALRQVEDADNSPAVRTITNHAAELSGLKYRARIPSVEGFAAEGTNVDIVNVPSTFSAEELNDSLIARGKLARMTEQITDPSTAFTTAPRTTHKNQLCLDNADDTLVRNAVPQAGDAWSQVYPNRKELVAVMIVPALSDQQSLRNSAAPTSGASEHEASQESGKKPSDPSRGLATVTTANIIHAAKTRSGVAEKRGTDTRVSCVPKSTESSKHKPHRPEQSLHELASSALRSASNLCMSSMEVVDWVRGNFPYYRNAGVAWQNSIRATLSTNKDFEKLSNPSAPKKAVWRLVKEHSDHAAEDTEMPDVNAAAETSESDDSAIFKHPVTVVRSREGSIDAVLGQAANANTATHDAEIIQEPEALSSISSTASQSSPTKQTSGKSPNIDLSKHFSSPRVRDFESFARSLTERKVQEHSQSPFPWERTPIKFSSTRKRNVSPHFSFALQVSNASKLRRVSLPAARPELKGREDASDETPKQNDFFKKSAVRPPASDPSLKRTVFTPVRDVEGSDDELA